MRIGIDARMYGPRQGGLGRYLQQLILQLEQIESTDEFVIFLRKENWDDYTPKNISFKKVLADIPWYSWREQLQLPGIIKKENVSLMHFPHWNVPLFYKDQFVVTIHDLLLLHYPTRAASTLGPITYWCKNLAYKFVLRHAVKKSEHIIAVSEFTKLDLRKTLGIPLDKITVIYQAPFDNFQFPNNQLLDTYDISKPYVLYVGVAYPHKNLSGLLRAWKLFEEKYGHECQLVLVGKNNYFYAKLRTLNSELRTANVVFTDFVPDDSLPALYQNAALYVNPSLYEGFALPALEAMSHGLPVASSNATCLPEVLGSAALYFDPKNYSEMAEAIHEGLTNVPLRTALVAEGRKILTRYSAKKLAEKTYHIYQKNL